MIKILVIHGPNLNLLGKREVNIYGCTSFEAVNRALNQEALDLKVTLSIVQSNHEGEIVDVIGRARDEEYRGILINPAAYTHTSVAIRDALLACQLPAVEVHLSNIYKREEFRHLSLTAPACIGQISGFGLQSYLLGLKAIVSFLSMKSDSKKGKYRRKAPR